MFALLALSLSLPLLVAVPTTPAQAEVSSPAATQPARPGPQGVTSPECTITGTSGADVLRGTPGDDVICGLGGRDRLIGRGGDDILRGGSGRDELVGGTGDDSLDGQSGMDSGSGGRGDDVCAPDRDMIGCTIDQTGPEIRDIVAPATAPVGSPLRIRWTVVDGGGSTYAWARLSSPSGWVIWCLTPETRLVSERGNAATYEIECIPQPFIANQLLTAWIGAVDRLGNRSEDSTTQIQLVGGSDDLSSPAPTLRSMPSTVDPSEGDGVTFDVTWALTDESAVAYTQVWIYRPAGGGVLGWGVPESRTEAARLVSGDEWDGVWSQTFMLSSQEADGDYMVYVSVGDGVGNRDFVSLGTIRVQRCCVVE